MQLEHTPRKTFKKASFGTLATTLVAAAALIPAAAQAEVVGTHVVTPTTVSPHVVTPAPAPAPVAPAPAPSASPAPSATTESAPSTSSGSNSTSTSRSATARKGGSRTQPNNLRDLLDTPFAGPDRNEVIDAVLQWMDEGFHPDAISNGGPVPTESVDCPTCFAKPDANLNGELDPGDGNDLTRPPVIVLASVDGDQPSSPLEELLDTEIVDSSPSNLKELLDTPFVGPDPGDVAAAMRQWLAEDFHPDAISNGGAVPVTPVDCPDCLVKPDAVNGGELDPGDNNLGRKPEVAQASPTPVAASPNPASYLIGTSLAGSICPHGDYQRYMNTVEDSHGSGGGGCF